MPRLRTTGSAITCSASRNSGEALGEQVGLEQLDVARQRPDPDLVALLADVGELAQVVDVDQVLGVRQAQLHHRQQAVPAGDDPRLGAEPLQRGDRALDAGRALVLKRGGGLHELAPVVGVDLEAGRASGPPSPGGPDPSAVARLGRRLSARSPPRPRADRGPPRRSRPTALLAELRIVRGGPAALLARLVLHGCAGADDGRTGQLLRVRLPGLGVQGACVQAAALTLRSTGPVRARGGDRRLAAEPGQRERSLRVHLGDARGVYRLAVREVPQAGRRPPPDRARRPGRRRPRGPAFFTSRPSSRSTPASRFWLMSVTTSLRPGRSSR